MREIETERETERERQTERERRGEREKQRKREREENGQLELSLWQVVVSHSFFYCVYFWVQVQKNKSWHESAIAGLLPANKQTKPCHSRFRNGLYPPLALWPYSGPFFSCMLYLSALMSTASCDEL